jgi:hypothetical protein
MVPNVVELEPGLETQPIGPALYKLAGETADVYIAQEGGGFLVFSALRPLPGRRREQVLGYLLERNATAAVAPGAFAVRDGNIIYRVWADRGGLAAACTRVREVTAVYGPRLLRMA